MLNLSFLTVFLPASNCLLCGHIQFILEEGCRCMPPLLSTSQVSVLFSYHYVGQLDLRP
jgi:hypothetical protein